MQAVRWFWLSLVVLIGCQSGAAPTASTPGGVSVPRGGFRVTAEPAHSVLYVNGEAKGPVDQLADGGLLRLVPGIYRVELVAPGYQTWRAEVSVRRTVESLNIQLRPTN